MINDSTFLIIWPRIPVEKKNSDSVNTWQWNLSTWVDPLPSSHTPLHCCYSTSDAEFDSVNLRGQVSESGVRDGLGHSTYPPQFPLLHSTHPSLPFVHHSIHTSLSLSFFTHSVPRMSEMEDAANRGSSKPSPKQTLPPKRGQVKIRALNSIVKSVTAFARTSGAGGSGGRKNGNGNGASPTLSSPSTTPPIQSGYNSSDWDPHSPWLFPAFPVPSSLSRLCGSASSL